MVVVVGRVGSRREGGPAPVPLLVCCWDQPRSMHLTGQLNAMGYVWLWRVPIYYPGLLTNPSLPHHPSPHASHTHCAGILVSADSYMNIQLGSAEEWIEDKFAGKLGDLLIRCNNVLHLREVSIGGLEGGGSMEA